MLWFQELLITKKILDASNAAADAAQTLKRIEQQNTERDDDYRIDQGAKESDEPTPTRAIIVCPCCGLQTFKDQPICNWCETVMLKPSDPATTRNKERAETLGQQLIDLQRARKAGALTEQEYQSQRLKLMANS